MSQDFRGFLQQMQGCAVSVVTWDHARLLGTLAAVTDDCIRMTGVVLQDSHETGGWSDRLLIEDLLEDRGNQWPEIIIQRNLISTVTMVSETTRDVSAQSHPLSEALEGLESTLEALARVPETVIEHASDHTESVRLEIGSAWTTIQTVAGDVISNDLLVERITETRVALEKVLGFLLQPFRVQSVSTLAPELFRVLIHGVEVGRGTMIAGKLLAILPDKDTIQPQDSALPQGSATIEPVFGLPAVWIDPEHFEQAKNSGCTVVDPLSLMGTMLNYHVRRHAKELLTYEAVSAAVDKLRESHPVTVSNLMPHPVSLRSLFEVLRGLVGEGVVIRHLLPILESVGRHVEHCESMPLLLSRVRSDISLILCGPHLDDNGRLSVIVIDKEVVREVFPDDSEHKPADSSLRISFLDKIRRLHSSGDSASVPILLVPHASRERIWTHCRSAFEDLVVLSPAEVPLGVRLEVLGTVSSESIGRLSPELEDSPETFSEYWQRKPR